MKSRHFVERSAAGCFLALACCSVMLAQDALTATRKGLELMGQARYGEAEEFLHVLSRSRGRPIRPPFTIWRTFITGRVAFRKPSGYTAWLWSRLSAIMVPSTRRSRSP